MKNDFQPKVFVLSVYVHFKIDYFICYDASLLEMSMGQEGWKEKMSGFLLCLNELDLLSSWKCWNCFREKELLLKAGLTFEAVLPRIFE